MALLAMGTSHNRWYVERKFISWCGPEMEESLAKRLSVSFRIADKIVCRQISHLEESISISRRALHETLQRTITEICG